MAIAKYVFDRGQVVNPLSDVGDDLLKYGASLHQQEKDRLAAEKQNELLNMQKAEHQMKVDAVAQAAKEKEAANRYADALGAATSGNVISVPDQKILGEQVADMGVKARAAYASGNKGLSDEIVAEQESYINSVLPKMVKDYEASPEAQLQVLRGTNPLYGTGDLDPQTRLALLKAAEAPIEKTLDRAATHDQRLKEIKEQHKNARLLEGMRTANAFKEVDYKAEVEKKNKTWVDSETGKVVAYGTPNAMDVDAFSKLHKKEKDPNKEIKYKAIDSFGKTVIGTAEEMQAALLKDPTLKISSIGSDDKSGGDGTTKKSSGGLAKPDELNAAIAKIDLQHIGKGRKEAIDAVAEVRKELTALGLHPKVIDDILTKAVESGSAKTDWTGDSIEFQPRLFQDTVNIGISSALAGDYNKYGIINAVDVEKAEAWKIKNSLKPTDNNSNNANANNKNTVLPPVKKEIYRPDVEGEELRMILQANSRNRTSEEIKRAAELTDLQSRFVPVTDRDLNDLKNITDEYNHASVKRKRALLPTKQRLEKIVKQGGTILPKPTNFEAYSPEEAYFPEGGYLSD